MPLIPNQPNLLLEDIPYSEGDQYYVSSKILPDFFTRRFIQQIQNWSQNPEAVKKSFSAFKQYPQRPATALKPDLRLFRRINWEKVVLNRKSTRSFSPAPVLFSELSNLLQMSCGLKKVGQWQQKVSVQSPWPHRALASGGALYPLEVYILALNIKGLKKGLYHLNNAAMELSLLRSDAETFQLEKFWYQKKFFSNPAALIFVSAVFQKTKIKYGNRALRFILLEAGGLGAQMNLLATAMGLGFTYDGGGFENKIESLIGIDGANEGLVTSFVLGQDQ